MKLINQSKKIQLADHIEHATSMFARMKGLLGRDQLEKGHGIWLNPGNSIHSCFMKFPIDVIFLNKQMQVKRVCFVFQPWRLSPIVWGAKSVIELPAHTLNELNIEQGDQLDVVD